MLKVSRPYRARLQPAPGNIGLAMVLAFYLGSQAFIDSLGPDPATWESPHQRYQAHDHADLLAHPAFQLSMRR
jgi:hypothetical protein